MGRLQRRMAIYLFIIIFINPLWEEKALLKKKAKGSHLRSTVDSQDIDAKYWQ